MALQNLDGETSATTTICERTAVFSMDRGALDPEKSSNHSLVSLKADGTLGCHNTQRHNDLARYRDEKLSASCEKVIYVDFDEGDHRNPINFSNRKKWIITAMACFSTFLSSTTASSYNMGISSMVQDLDCSRLQALVALGVYTLGFGLVPLVTASFSEDFGRQPLYIGSGFGFLLMFILMALSKNIETVIFARLLQGSFGSTGATMVGGTIADIWLPHERGLPMSVFVLIAIGGTGLGPVYAGWIELNPHLGWRWIQWIQMILCAIYLVLLPLVLKETRSSVLLTRLAKKMRKETGDDRYRSRAEDEMPSLRHMVYVSCTRPLRLLCTEPVVISISAWIGFAWGVTFCMVASIPGVFKDLHGFNLGQTGAINATLIIGSMIGFMTNFYQERLYHKYFAKRGPEARLHTACFAAILLPVGMLMYAWSSYPNVHWIVQAIGITIFTCGTFIIYLAVFSYGADCYGIYASSALAGQSLARNLTATVFPLFTDQMFHNLGYKWANTLFALIAAVMIPIPFALYFYGPAIRRRSKFSRIVVEAQELQKLSMS
ncbi:MFS polyamine transporter [Lyophyllum atratum]|nr:MFS polyamine transporter [Lyophyllum atratum]